jgi:NTE family protein
VKRIPEHWVVFSIAATSVFAMSFDSTLIPIALVDIGRGVGETIPSRLSWIVTTYTIAMAATVVAVGRIGDRTGRRRTFLIGLTLFVCGSLIGGFSTSLWMILVARVIQGTGAAFVFPSSLGLVLTAWPASEATRAIAAWTATAAVAGAIGPSLGSALVDGPGWRSAFFVHVVVGVPALLYARKRLVDTARREDASLPDMVGSVLVAVMLGSAALVLAQVRAWGIDDRRVLGAIVAILVVLPVVVWRCRTHPAPVVEPRMLRIRTYRRTLGVSVLVAAGIFGNFAMMPQYLSRVWGYSTFRVGMAIVPFSIGASFAAVSAGRLARRFDEKWVLLSGMGAFVLAMVWFRVFVGTSPNYWVGFMPGVVLTGIGGWGISMSMLNSIGARDLDGGNYGVGMGILMTARQVGALAGVATAFGLLGGTDLAPADAYVRIRQVWLFLIPVFVVAMLAALRLPARRPALDTVEHREVRPIPGGTDGMEADGCGR